MKIYSNGSQLAQEIGGFRIYGNGEILWKTDRSYIEREQIKNDKISSFYGSRIDSIDFGNHEIKKSNKLNLNRKDIFYIWENMKYSYPERQLVLYIPESLAQVTNHGEIIRTELTHETNFIMGYTIQFLDDVSYDFAEWKVVEILDGMKLTREQIRNSFTGSKLNGTETKRYYKEHKTVTSTEITVSGDYITRTEYDDFATQARTLQKEFEEMGVKGLATYEIQKIMKKYDIIKKEA